MPAPAPGGGGGGGGGAARGGRPLQRHPLGVYVPEVFVFRRQIKRGLRRL